MRSKLMILTLVGLVLCMNTARGQQTASQTQTPPAVQLPPWMLHAKLIHEIAPEYPVSARESRIQGNVLIDVLVNEKGKVQKAYGLDCPSCSPILRESAVKAVEQWEYEPTLLDGNPVSVRSWIIFRFQLEKEPSVEVLSKSEVLPPGTESPKFDGWIAASAPGNVSPGKLRISAGVMEANLIHKIDPEYPHMAKIAHIQGDVVLRCIIDNEGNIAEMRIISGHPVFAQPALDAVKQWKYKPYVLNGKPVEVETAITVRFRM